MNKKIKKLILVSALLVLATIATAVIVTALNSRSETSKMSTLIADEENWSVGKMEEIINACQNVPLSELSCYSFEELSRFAGSRGIVLNLNSVGSTLSWLIKSARVSVDNIQKIDDNHIAAIFNVSEDNLDNTFALVIFKRNIVLGDDDTQNEIWEKTGEMYFLNDVHGNDDYCNIIPGSSIEELYMIDSSIRYDVLRQEQCLEDIEAYSQGKNDGVADNIRMIYKLLKDGVMTIKYDLSEMAVIEKNYYAYGELSSFCVSVTNPNLCSYFEASELAKK